MVLIEQFAMQIFLWLLALIDGLMNIFAAISGVDDVMFNGTNVNILETFLMGNSVVATVFWCIFLLAIGLGVIFAIIAIIKNMVANNKNITSILGKFALFLVGTLALFAIIYVGILISNAVLKLLAEIFEYDQGGLANALFDACVGENYTTIPDSNAKWTIDTLLRNEGVSSITEVSVDALLGEHREWAIFAGNEDWKNNGYIIAADFQYLLALIGAGIVLFELLIVSAHLAKRLFEIVFLYVSMPASVSTLPMDDGARFKNWRESFVTKVIIVYGAVIGVNIFVVCISSFSRMSLQNVGWFENALFYVVMIIGGAMMLSSSIELFAKVFGNGEDVNQARRLFAGIGHLAGHAAIALTGRGLHAIGAPVKMGANKAYGSYNNTHGGAKAAAKHDIATARYREQLEAKAAAKTSRGGSAAQGAGASAASPGADGGSAASSSGDAGGGGSGGEPAQGGSSPGQPSVPSSGDAGNGGIGNAVGGGNTSIPTPTSNSSSAAAFGGAATAAVLLSGGGSSGRPAQSSAPSTGNTGNGGNAAPAAAPAQPSAPSTGDAGNGGNATPAAAPAQSSAPSAGDAGNGGNAAPAAAPAQSSAPSAGDAGNGGNAAQPTSAQNGSASQNGGGNTAISGPAGRDGRDGKAGERGRRGERGLDGKDGASASPSTSNIAENSVSNESRDSNAAVQNNVSRSAIQHENGANTEKATQSTAKPGETNAPVTPTDKGGNKE